MTDSIIRNEDRADQEQDNGPHPESHPPEQASSVPKATPEDVESFSRIKVQHEIGPMERRLEELLKRRGDVYQRAGKLVSLIMTTKGLQRIREIKTPILAKMASDYLWVKAGQKHGKPNEQRIKPIPEVLDALLAEGYWDLPALEGLTTAPTLLPDGSILDTPGYDKRSGLYYTPSESFAPIPHEASREEALRCLEVVKDLFCDFPFVSQEDLSATLGALFTLVIRNAIGGPCPMTLFSAPESGTGKSFLCETVVELATGQPLVCHSFPKGEDEQRKTLFSLALGGSAAVCFDNVVGSLSSATLCSYLTAPTFGSRLLSTNSAEHAPATVVILATGNNVRTKGDLTRRTVRIEIDAKMARPENREGFKYPQLADHIRRERKNLIPAILTILRAYYTAGCPWQKVTPIGSYNKWSDMIRQPLIWIGAGDPGAKLLSARKAGDDDLDAITEVLRMWHKTFGSRQVLAKSVLETESVELRAALVNAIPGARTNFEGRLEGVKVTQMGTFLGSLKDRILDVDVSPNDKPEIVKCKFEAGERRKGGMLWALKMLGGKPSDSEAVSEGDLFADTDDDTPF